jgi:hypothetical protein
LFEGVSRRYDCEAIVSLSGERVCRLILYWPL